MPVAGCSCGRVHVEAGSPEPYPGLNSSLDALSPAQGTWRTPAEGPHHWPVFRISCERKLRLYLFLISNHTLPTLSFSPPSQRPEAMDLGAGSVGSHLKEVVLRVLARLIHSFEGNWSRCINR